MQDGPRILIAAALGRIIEPILRQSLTDATIRIAEDKAAVQRAINDRLRFDVVVTDLTWMDYAVEYSFDGLDVLNALRQAGWSASAGRQPGPRRLSRPLTLRSAEAAWMSPDFPPAIARQISRG